MSTTCLQSISIDTLDKPKLPSDFIASFNHFASALWDCGNARNQVILAFIYVFFLDHTYIIEFPNCSHCNKVLHAICTYIQWLVSISLQSFSLLRFHMHHKAMTKVWSCCWGSCSIAIGFYEDWNNAVDKSIDI